MLWSKEVAMRARVKLMFFRSDDAGASQRDASSQGAIPRPVPYRMLLARL